MAKEKLSVEQIQVRLLEWAEEGRKKQKTSSTVKKAEDVFGVKAE